MADIDTSTAGRIDALDAYGVVDSPREAEFDEITALAARLCEVPVALVSLVEADRQWFKSAVGLDLEETPIEQSVCAHALAAGTLLEISDLTQDARTKSNTLVTAGPEFRFYAGAVLSTPEGVPYGTLCVLDHVPRTLSEVQKSMLLVLARQVMKELDLRLALRRQDVLQREIDHRVKNSLQSVASFVRVQAQYAAGQEARELLAAVGRRIASVALLHQELYQAAVGENVALESYMGRIAHLFASAAPEGVVVESAFEPATVTPERASALAGIANEFATNSFKYAFPDRRGGSVSIVGRTAADDTVTVTMRDDGVGIANGAPLKGLGFRIIEASAQQMGATLVYDAAPPGFGLTLTFPLVRPHSAFDISREAGLAGLAMNGAAAVARR